MLYAKLVVPLVFAVGAGLLADVASTQATPAENDSPRTLVAASAQAAVPASLTVRASSKKRKRASVSVNAIRLSNNRIQVQVKSNAKRSTIRAYSVTGKRLATRTIKHRSSRVTVKVALASSANAATRIKVTTRKVKINRNLTLLSRSRSVSVPRQVTASAPSSYATQLLALVNAARSKSQKCGSRTFGAVGKLKLNSKLALAAQRHSADMADYNYFSHVSRNSQTLGERVDKANYKWSWLGENIAAGQTNAKQAHNAWMKSQGHCENVMNGSFKEMGIGVASNSRSDYKIYWTQVFGAPR